MLETPSNHQKQFLNKIFSSVFKSLGANDSSVRAAKVAFNLLKAEITKNTKHPLERAVENQQFEVLIVRRPAGSV